MNKEEVKSSKARGKRPPVPYASGIKLGDLNSLSQGLLQHYNEAKEEFDEQFSQDVT
jgi:thiamine pyrophosphokinase